MIDVYETKDIILTWIESAETCEQCDLLLDVTGRFVIDRFYNTIPKREMDKIKTELRTALARQMEKIIWGNFPRLIDAPTLQYNLK